MASVKAILGQGESKNWIDQLSELKKDAQKMKDLKRAATPTVTIQETLELRIETNSMPQLNSEVKETLTKQPKSFKQLQTPAAGLVKKEKTVSKLL